MEGHTPDKMRGIYVQMPVGYQPKFDDNDKDFILLKFGWVKSYRLNENPKSLEALQECDNLEMEYSQPNDLRIDKQKMLICKAIDAFKGNIESWWDNKPYESKEQAKKYIMDYKHTLL